MAQDVDPDLPEMPDVLRRFLARSVLLYGVPFSYLVPDERMLPPESIRWFHIDPGWIATLAQGATSVGRPTPKDSEIDTYLRYNALTHALSGAAGLRAAPADAGEPTVKQADWPLTGFLMRSEVVAGWQGVEMHAMDKAGAELAPLRIDRLSPGIMLCIFNGVVDVLTVKQPPEGMHFGLSPDAGGGYRRLKLRNLNGSFAVTTIKGPLAQQSASRDASARWAYKGDAAWAGGTLSADQITALTAGFSATAQDWDYAVDNARMGLLDKGGVTLGFTVTTTQPGRDDVVQDVALSLSGTGAAPQIVQVPGSGAKSQSSTVDPGAFFPACFKTDLQAPMRAPASAGRRPTRTVHIARLAQDIQAQLQAHQQSVPKFTSAEFGVQMVESPGFVTFKAQDTP
ncbi:hypothetical protein [Tropicibacter oceani]|uniref:Uncharacterized protein n=1 Tax=Tropicibacter oceani TaxID=3058420 RepID=A0ABY8QE51_9RHOB|nr:hypothetical protein [Tropicibacter oceani]WGW02909.1 hypothetical protein QF118_13300 [Tropicibacter oceani]